MAPLRIVNDLSNEYTNYSSQTVHETRHHGKHNRLRLQKEKEHNYVDMISDSIVDMVSNKFVGENSVLPDLEPLSAHIDSSIERQYHSLKVNFTNNFTDFDVIEKELFFRHNGAMTAVYCVAYLVVFVVGLVGNCFVIAVVYRSPRMRTVTNFFIVNLALADILVIVFCLPATLMSNIFVREYI